VVAVLSGFCSFRGEQAKDFVPVGQIHELSQGRFSSNWAYKKITKTGGHLRT